MENMQKKNNSMWIWLLVIVVVALAIFFLRKEKTTEVADINSPDAIEVTEDISAGSINEPKAVGVAPVTQSYTDALVKYADRRIQFDKICQAFPNTVTYKDNTGIMLDNRSGVTRTIKVGTTYTVKPYGFKIVVLPDIYLQSKRILVDCDKSQNVATILIQE